MIRGKLHKRLAHISIEVKSGKQGKFLCGCQLHENNIELSIFAPIVFKEHDHFNYTIEQNSCSKK